MRTIITDIGQEIGQNSTLTSILGTRYWSKPPKKEPSSPFLVYTRTNRVRDDVRDRDSFRFEVFAKNITDLENIADALISQFDGKTQLGTADTGYYRVSFIQESDEAIQLKNTQMWVKLLYFDFYKTS